MLPPLYPPRQPQPPLQGRVQGAGAGAGANAPAAASAPAAAAAAAEAKIAEVKGDAREVETKALERAFALDSAVNEKWLFHGTGKGPLEMIKAAGFNRSYCTSGVVYGRGVYFAVDSIYSASTSYAKPDSKGIQYMFLARVLVGDAAPAKSGDVAPPLKSHGGSADRPAPPYVYYDSTQASGIHVIYSDSQALPCYVLEFVPNNYDN